MFDEPRFNVTFCRRTSAPVVSECVRPEPARVHQVAFERHQQFHCARELFFWHGLSPVAVAVG